jgi:hypothetical protein
MCLFNASSEGAEMTLIASVKRCTHLNRMTDSDTREGLSNLSEGPNKCTQRSIGHLNAFQEES